MLFCNIQVEIKKKLAVYLQVEQLRTVGRRLILQDWLREGGAGKELSDIDVMHHPERLKQANSLAACFV